MKYLYPLHPSHLQQYHSHYTAILNIHMENKSPDYNEILIRQAVPNSPTEYDEIVKTDKDIDILLDKREEFLDGVWIKYFHVPEPGFELINPQKGSHGHHH